MSAKLTDKLDNKAGSYLLILKNKEQQTVTVGQLGEYDFKEGYYIYVGSALGPGGVESRVKRHSKKNKKLHWHIDYLRAVTDLVEVWYLYSNSRYEHQFADLLEQFENIEIPISDFGASDCKCQAHLFFSSNLPSFAKFKEKLNSNSKLLKITK